MVNTYEDFSGFVTKFVERSLETDLKGVLEERGYEIKRVNQGSFLFYVSKKDQPAGDSLNFFYHEKRGEIEFFGVDIKCYSEEIYDDLSKYAQKWESFGKMKDGPVKKFQSSITKKFASNKDLDQYFKR